DPHGSPRPARGARDVPVRTSIYFELEVPLGAKGGDITPESVSVDLQPARGTRAELLLPGAHFAKGCRGWLRPKHDLQGKKTLAVYSAPPLPLNPGTTYKVTFADSAPGKLAATGASGTWSFTTASADVNRQVSVAFDLRHEPVRWHGQFFSGVCNVVFCTQAG